MFGIYEVIALALALGGFGVQNNPKAPSADVVLEYAVEDADAIAYVDAVPLIPGNYSALKKLPDAPEIKGSAVLKDVVGKAIAEVEGARGALKTAVGVDLTTDLSNVVVFAKLSTPPELLIVARGKFPTDMPTKIGKMMGGKSEKIGDAEAVALGGPIEIVAVNKGGVLFAGSRALITARLDAKWKSPARAKGSLLAEAAKILGDKPVYMAAVSMSSGRLVKLVESGSKTRAKLIERFEMVAGAVYHNGIGWMVKDKDADGHARSAMASDGVIDLMRAAHLAPRGIVKVLMSVLDDVGANEPELAELKKHKDDVMKLLEQFTGDGKFKVKTDADKKNFRLSVRASGKQLSDVVPVGFILPMMWLGYSTSNDKTPASTMVKQPITTKSTGGIKTPPKPAPKPAPKPQPKTK
jgi:hypothetical protein